MNINIAGLEGRMDQAVKPVRYVVLTNDKDLPFRMSGTASMQRPKKKS